MATSYIGEIRMFGGNFAPAGWAFCNGQALAISEYSTLYSLIGTAYGGNGTTTFNLPDLQGRLPVHVGNGFVIGQQAGEENHTVTVREIPGHTHTVAGMGQATTNAVAGNMYAGGGVKAYKAGPPSATMNAAVVQNNPGGQPHNNLMPFGVVSFIISLFGIYPSQN